MLGARRFVLPLSAGRWRWSITRTASTATAEQTGDVDAVLHFAEGQLGFPVPLGKLLRAGAWIKYQQALMPGKPSFVYSATHAPHHVPKEWMARWKGKSTRAGTCCARRP